MSDGVNEGLFALGGVAIGAVLGWVGETVRSSKARKRRATYLAVRVIIALDEYVGRCASVLSNKDFDREEEGEVLFEEPEKLALPTDVDWSSIDATKAFEILALQNKDQDARESINFKLDVNGTWAARDTRDHRFSEIALEAHRLAGVLRQKYGLKSRITDYWEPAETLQRIRENITKERTTAP